MFLMHKRLLIGVAAAINLKTVLGSGNLDFGALQGYGGAQTNPLLSGTDLGGINSSNMIGLCNCLPESICKGTEENAEQLAKLIITLRSMVTQGTTPSMCMSDLPPHVIATAGTECLDTWLKTLNPFSILTTPVSELQFPDAPAPNTCIPGTTTPIIPGVTPGVPPPVPKKVNFNVCEEFKSGLVSLLNLHLTGGFAGINQYMNMRKANLPNPLSDPVLNMFNSTIGSTGYNTCTGKPNPGFFQETTEGINPLTMGQQTIGSPLCTSPMSNMLLGLGGTSGIYGDMSGMPGMCPDQKTTGGLFAGMTPSIYTQGGSGACGSQTIGLLDGLATGSACNVGGFGGPGGISSIKNACITELNPGCAGIGANFVNLLMHKGGIYKALTQQGGASGCPPCPCQDGSSGTPGSFSGQTVCEEIKGPAGSCGGGSGIGKGQVFDQLRTSLFGGSVPSASGFLSTFGTNLGTPQNLNVNIGMGGSQSNACKLQELQRAMMLNKGCRCSNTTMGAMCGSSPVQSPISEAMASLAQLQFGC